MSQKRFIRCGLDLAIQAERKERFFRWICAGGGLANPPHNWSICGLRELRHNVLFNCLSGHRGLTNRLHWLVGHPMHQKRDLNPSRNALRPF